MKSCLSFITVLLLSFASYAQEHTIQGVVFDKTTYDYLPFERVSLHRTEKSDTVSYMSVLPAVTVLTNVDGFFKFENLQPGTYLIVVKSWGLNPYEQQLTVTEKDGTTELRIELTNENPMSTYFPENE